MRKKKVVLKTSFEPINLRVFKEAVAKEILRRY